MPPTRGGEYSRRCSIKRPPKCVFLLQLTGIPYTHTHPHTSNRVGSEPRPQLCLAALDSIVDGYLGQCVAPATHTAYSAAQHQYAAFCQKFQLTVLFPLLEDNLCRFVAYLAQEGLKYCTIKSYLSGLRFY